MKRKFFNLKTLFLGFSILLFIILLNATLGKNNLWQNIKSAFAGESRYLDLVFTDVITTKDVKYGSADGENLLLDIYEPKDDSQTMRPVVILVHGGGFVSGDKSAFEKSATDLSKRGYVAMSINYRLANGNGLGMNSGSSTAIQNAKNDTLAAVRFVRASAVRYRVDPSKIIVGGFSAGAVTSLYAAYDTANVGSSGTPGVSSKIALAFSFSGGMLPENLNTIGAGDPPAILINSDNDDIVPISTAQTVYDRLKSLGIATELDVYHVGHATPGVAEAQQKVRQFMYRTLGLSGTVITTSSSSPTTNPTSNPDSSTNSPSPTSDVNSVPQSGDGHQDSSGRSLPAELFELLPGLNPDEATAAYKKGAMALYKYIVGTHLFSEAQIRAAAYWWITQR